MATVLRMLPGAQTAGHSDFDLMRAEIHRIEEEQPERIKADPTYLIDAAIAVIKKNAEANAHAPETGKTQNDWFLEQYGDALLAVMRILPGGQTPGHPDNAALLAEIAHIRATDPDLLKDPSHVIDAAVKVVTARAKETAATGDAEEDEIPRERFRDVFEYWNQSNLQYINSQEWVVRGWENERSHARDLFPDVTIPGSRLYVEIERYLDKHWEEIEGAASHGAIAVAIRCAQICGISPCLGDEGRDKRPMP